MKYENSFFEIKCILYKVPSGDERLFLFENYGHWSWLPYQESLDTYNSLANYNKSTLYSIVCTHSICLYLPILDLFKAKQALSSDHHPPQPKKASEQKETKNLSYLVSFREERNPSNHPVKRRIASGVWYLIEVQINKFISRPFLEEDSVPLKV